jgi:hypothetical protein
MRKTRFRHRVVASVEDGELYLRCYTAHDPCEFNLSLVDLGVWDALENMKGKGMFPLAVTDRYGEERDNPSWEWVVIR